MKRSPVPQEFEQLHKPREAANKLNISERQLWSLTSPRGPIRCVRLGHCLRYSAEALLDFIEAQEQASVEVAES